MSHGRRRGGEGTNRAVKAILARDGRSSGTGRPPSEDASARGVLTRGLPSPQVKLDDGGLVLDDELGITWAAGHAMRDGLLTVGDDVLVDPCGHDRFVLVGGVLWGDERARANQPDPETT